jgi:hypothetical protein
MIMVSNIREQLFNTYKSFGGGRPVLMEPDWDKLGADYFVADWERRFWKLSAGKKEAETTNASE